MPLARVPGRVNLIGDHTDYQDGWCVPMTIDRELQLSFAAAPTTRVEGVARRWTDALPPHTAFTGTIESTIPIGSGLSSSAALAVALILASTHLRDRELALAAQALEQRATGVPCGVMDQMACVFGRAAHAVLLDCRSLDVVHVALPPQLIVTVIDSGLPRTLAGSAYADRRAACEAAAARLGVATLRDATLEQIADDPIARHVVSENARVLAFVAALRAGDVEKCGALMLASHASLRDDFRVSTPELDALVDAAMQNGALGARLTGAGFGGCVVAISTAELDIGFPVRAVDGASVMQ